MYSLMMIRQSYNTSQS
uniref:Uncharacterized protein n=1 Tax=Rhizophora mucronata TaxID=61149 RepID=A0A2P2NE04_RHIMU